MADKAEMNKKATKPIVFLYWFGDRRKSSPRSLMALKIPLRTSKIMSALLLWWRCLPFHRECDCSFWTALSEASCGALVEKKTPFLNIFVENFALNYNYGNANVAKRWNINDWIVSERHKWEQWEVCWKGVPFLCKSSTMCFIFVS